MIAGSARLAAQTTWLISTWAMSRFGRPATGPLLALAAGTDESLVARAAGGDRRAFDDLYRRYVDLVWGRLGRLLGPDPEREDLLQQIFLEVFRALPRFLDPSACKVAPMDDTRCALCPSPNGMVVVVVGCLKCGAPVKTTAAGDFCRTCGWSDLMAGQCLQCYTADGTSTLDDCDALRSKPATPSQ